MGTTNTGLPYPEPTNPIAQGADATKALAQAVNQPLSGSVPVNIANATSGTAVVTFTAGYFTATPRVVGVSQSSGNWIIAIAAVSATSATIRVGTAGSAVTATVTVLWIAVR
jgi:ABC-type branched-subunit amino acid transport system substrate-binding protein